MKIYKSIILAIIAAPCVALGLLIYPIYHASRPSWPKIVDPAALLIEANALCRSTPLGLIPKENWPTEIASLKPQHVTTTQGHLYVTISGGGINASWGYLIFPDGRSEGIADNGLRVIGTVAPGVFKFETVE